MPHHRDDRRSRLQACRIVVSAFEADFNIGFRHTLYLVTEFLCDQLGRFTVDGLCCRRHHAKFHQFLDHIGGPFRHPVGEFGHRDGVRHNDITHLFDLRNIIPHPGLFALSPDRGKRALTPLLVTGQCLRDRHLAGLATAGPVPARRGWPP